MFRKLLVVIAVLLFGDCRGRAELPGRSIDERQALMKANGDHGQGRLGDMIKGEAPFDLAKAEERSSRHSRDAAAKMPALFPDCSKTGEHTTAAPAIWDKHGRFQGRSRQVLGRR